MTKQQGLRGSSLIPKTRLGVYSLAYIKDIYLLIDKNANYQML